MPDVLIPEFMDEGAAAMLKAEYDVHWDPQLWSRRPELIAAVRSARAIVVRNQTRVDPELIAAGGKLKVVARMGVGLDNIDVATCKARGIEVVPSIGANALSVAEYVIATAMILLRGPQLLGTAELVAGGWPRERFARGGVELAGRTMGIIGFGSIGQVTAGKAKAMGMDVIAYDAILPASAPAWSGYERVDLDALIARSDIISLHCPLVPETRGLIGAAQMARMKKGAIVINSARGGIVDEAACAAALRSGQLGGAALDSFDKEPIEKGTGALFTGIPNVILSPHIAGVTQESNRRIALVAVDTVRRVLGKTKP